MCRTMFEAMAADAANDAEGLPPGAPRPRPRACHDCGSTRRVLPTTYREGHSDDLMLCRRCFNDREAEEWFA